MTKPPAQRLGRSLFCKCRPALTNAASLCILNAVGAPYNPYWRVDALEHAALSSLALIHAQVLVIDEVHQLLAGSAREQRLSLNLIKSISNDLRISIVVVGTGDARRLRRTLRSAAASIHSRYRAGPKVRNSVTSSAPSASCIHCGRYPSLGSAVWFSAYCTHPRVLPAPSRARYHWRSSQRSRAARSRNRCRLIRKRLSMHSARISGSPQICWHQAFGRRAEQNQRFQLFAKRVD